MILRHRKYRVSLAIAAAAQAIVFGGVLYLNCGTFDEPLSVPPCTPWLPPGFAVLLPAFIRTAPWLAEPGMRITPAFRWIWGPPLPVWFQEWIPAVAVIGLNLAFWTPLLGTLFVGAERLSKHWRNRPQDAPRGIASRLAQHRPLCLRPQLLQYGEFGVQRARPKADAVVRQLP